ncbi:MAG: long-chain fatty acid--CoA ligase [Spirochaetia bacterium]|nr:long-chain fatty acid--CoA ligase [Spirochaetia bacterium]
MNGLMMNYELTIDRILMRAEKMFPEQEIVSRLADGSIHRYTYGDFFKRTLRLMNALRELGVKPGDRVATFAWNSYRHMEIYFAVPDKFIFVDKSLSALVSAQKDKFKTVKNYIVMDDKHPAPLADLPNPLDYETLLAGSKETIDFPSIKEDTAAGMCYTSGTTGEPKGVLYSHRSIFLHAMGISMADSLAISGRDVILPVVPMFHVMSWGIPFACCLTGAKPVFPGSQLIGKPLAELLEQERVTLAAGVPTIWNVLLQHLQKEKHDLSSIRAMIVGGSAAPRAMIEAYEKQFGISILHAWGMTETSPLGTVSRLKGFMEDWSEDKQYKQRSKQGVAVPLVEVKIVDDEGKELPWNGTESGELFVRGPWIASSYYKSETPSGDAAFTSDGWFGTGDVATIDATGFMEITDRKKDLIKTRGEWISSVEMENMIMSFNGVLEAAVVGRPDDVRGEVPVAFITLVPEKKDSVTAKQIHDLLSDKFAHWQLPKLTDIRFVDAIPKTSVGKFDKKVLRKQL